MKCRKMKALLLAGAMTAALLTTPSQAMKTQSPQTDGFLTNGEPITEENVLELLRQLEADWPTGTPWDDPKLNPDTRKNTAPSTESGKLMRSYHTNGTYGCGGYASMVSSLIFGNKTNPCRRVKDLTQIRPGDIIFRVSNATGKIWHVTIALESPSDIHAYHVTDGNRGGIVYWPDRDNPYGRENLDSYGEGKSHHLEVWTRYPESVPYTGNSVGAWPTGMTEE